MSASSGFEAVFDTAQLLIGGHPMSVIGRMPGARPRRKGRGKKRTAPESLSYAVLTTEVAE
jgi:hypothetical protein